MQAGGPQGTAGTQRDPQTDDCTYGQRDPQTGGRTYGQRGLIFTNLVDFDSKYGHRRDVAGYARALEEFDAFLPQLLDALAPDSLLVLTADHGNDPCAKGFNHTREYVPVLYHGAGVSSRDLGTGETLADIGATISAVLGVAPPRNGSPAEI
ncbi:MAG: hypothetical protein LBO07_00385 [Coriobacteriales bacterium]|nr:hypothetical protein [Coriobacteriales bacterium]